MADTFSKRERSKIMSRIKSKNTKLEVNFRKQLWAAGLRYKIHYNIGGKPDIVFVSRKIVVFIDSCFWHKCHKHFRRPSSNRKYWDNKLKRNVARDQEVKRILQKEGWKVLRFWEHSLVTATSECIRKVKKAYFGKRMHRHSRGL